MSDEACSSNAASVAEGHRRTIHSEKSSLLLLTHSPFNRNKCNGLKIQIYVLLRSKEIKETQKIT